MKRRSVGLPLLAISLVLVAGCADKEQRGNVVVSADLARACKMCVHGAANGGFSNGPPPPEGTPSRGDPFLLPP